MKIGFDHDQYTRMQSEHIRERISQFGGKLYLELGGACCRASGRTAKFPCC